MRDFSDPTTTPCPTWYEVRQPVTDKLLFRYDPGRQLVEIKTRQVVTVVDLTQYQVNSTIYTKSDE